MIYNPEDPTNTSREAGSDIPEEDLTPEEMSDLEDAYKINSAPSNVSVAGATILAGVAAFAVAPQDAEAASGQDKNDKEAQVQAESAERAVVQGGTVNHPTVGNFSFSVFRKTVDMSNPTFTGSMYGVTIDGQEVQVTSARFIRSGAGAVKFQIADGKEVTLTIPGVNERLQGKKAEFEADGQKVEVE